jgi:Zn-dependent membrane protease YugP
MSDVLVEVFASNPPSILIALAFVLLFFGFTIQVADMINAGWIFLVIGVLLQVLWLFLSKR